MTLLPPAASAASAPQRTPEPLKGKVAIVTGGAAGIGLAIVNQFLNHGAQVAVLDIADLSQFESTPGVYALQCDISREEEVDKAVGTIMSKWNRLDILVNNAGVMDTMARIGEVENKTWEKCFAVNVNGPMFLIRRCIKVFQTQQTDCSIINICSISSVRGATSGAADTASKHALLGISRNTAWMYAKEGIRCNAILPGGVATNIMDNINIDEVGSYRLSSYMSCMPNICQADEVAKVALFLCTSEGVNGAEIAVDHGWTTS
ncbi:hypothetical protein MMC06_006684 [Schaereria dolodes]|nr:hypothetical protein [Schaereria dolodes]